MMQRRCARTTGFTLLEFAVVVTIFALLVGVLLGRLDKVRQHAELADAETLAGLIQGVLTVKVSELRAAQKEEGIAKLADENPIVWLDRRPVNYLGEYYSPNIDRLPRGVWYFDKTDKSLVYLLNYGKSFADGTPKLLKFKVKLSRLSQNVAKPAAPDPVAVGAVLEKIVVTN